MTKLRNKIIIYQSYSLFTYISKTFSHLNLSKMKKFIQLGLFILIAGFTTVNAQLSNSKWQPQPITIDGNGSDWGSLPRFFNENSNVRYEFRNDDQNLYIILNSADRATHMQMQMAGFSIKLKLKTSPVTKFSLTFPGMNKGDMPMMREKMGKEDNLVEKSVSRPEFMPKDSVILDGFQFSNGKIQSDCENPQSICYASSKGNREQSTYEIRIPLREIFGNGYEMGAISKIPVQLQVTINELSKNQMNKSGGKTGGRMSGGGGRMGGGMRGGMGGGMPGGGDMGGGMPGGGGEMGGGMPGGDDMGGGEMGERPQMQQGEMSNESSFDKKTFSIDFRLSDK